jgi:hypothetical protein
LSWFDARGDRYLCAEEQERLAKEQAQQRVELLEILLRSQCIATHIPLLMEAAINQI